MNDILTLLHDLFNKKKNYFPSLYISTISTNNILKKKINNKNKYKNYI